MTNSESTVADATETDPEIGHTVTIDGVRINYHDTGGEGEAVLLLHGSGPGVSAWANWSRVLPPLGEAGFRAIAPDIPGFGYSDPIPKFSMERWTELVVAFLDNLGLERVYLVGNSFGGALAIHVAAAAPERLLKVVTMGTGGGPFRITPGLEAVWAYEPSVENMRQLLDVFAYDRSLVTDDLAEVRYRASIRPGAHEAYAALFPAPRQRWVDSMALSPQKLASIHVPFLLVHGRDDQVVPLGASLQVFSHLPNSELHCFSQCGHWVQIERNRDFVRLLTRYFGPEQNEEGDRR